MAEFAVIAVVAVGVGSALIERVDGWIDTLIFNIRRMLNYTTKITQSKNEMLFRYMTETLDPLCARLDHKELMTLTAPWDGSDRPMSNKVFRVAELDHELIMIMNPDAKRGEKKYAVSVRRFFEPTSGDGYRIYNKNTIEADMFLEIIYKKMGMKQEEITRLTPYLVKHREKEFERKEQERIQKELLETKKNNVRRTKSYVSRS